MEFEMWVYRGLIVVLGSGLVYFIKDLITGLKELKKEFREAFQGMKDAIAELRATIATEEVRHNSSDVILEKHDDAICQLKQTTSKHGEEIAVLKEKVK